MIDTDCSLDMMPWWQMVTATMPADVFGGE